MKMKIKKSEHWAWFLLAITLLMLIMKIAGLAPIPWWVALTPIWFPLGVITFIGFLLVLIFFAINFKNRIPINEEENKYDNDEEDEK